MQIPSKIKLTLIALISFFIASFSVSAQYPEDDITVIIPYSAGGGFDSYVRGVLPAIQKHLPNSINLIPRNMPGAGGRKGATAIFRARPDGYTIGAFNLPGLLLPHLLEENVGYDLSEVSWLGRISEDRYSIVVASSSDINSIDDLRALGRPILFTVTGVHSSAHAATMITTNVLGLNARFITGYEGSQNYVLAVVRGDGDVALGPSTSVRSYTETGDLKVIASLSDISPLESVDTAADLGKPELAKLNVQRMLGGPPNMNTQAHTILSNALVQALVDPELIEWSNSTGLPLAPLSATETELNVASQWALYENYKDIL
jgi:tripartite-type tricarboxylate transporter receptor subunit TctC